MRVRDIAKLENLTVASVERFIRIGRLHATTDAKGYVISDEDYETFRRVRELKSKTEIKKQYDKLFWQNLEDIVKKEATCIGRRDKDGVLVLPPEDPGEDWSEYDNM